ncbi:MAG TPA: ATP-binding cassette domain-containing protein, partial [Caldilineaceae bacterium]|nr:ATP-binding cassette domain-containing protein [Caldilineaceae bacterium]
MSFQLGRNEAMVILGESGCGKTSLARAILRLLPRNVHTYSGHIYLNGTDIMTLAEEEFRRQVRWVKISLVPQAAMSALNPVLKVGEQVTEPLITHFGMKKQDAREQAQAALQRVGV